MPIWLVKATWKEDEAEASEQWEVSAATAHDAVRDVTAHIRFHPHHIEAQLCSSEGQAPAQSGDLEPGQVRRRIPSP
jgi:hypothetical protein